MDSAHGQSRRQTVSSAKQRRDPESDFHSTRNVKSVSSSEQFSGNSTLKDTAVYSSTGANQPGRHFKLESVVSRLGQPDDGQTTPKSRRTQDTATRNNKQKKEDGALPKQANNHSSNRSKHRGDGSTTKSKLEDKTKTSKFSDDKVHTQKDKEPSQDSKSHSQTPKNKRRARSLSRPRDTHVDPEKGLLSTNQDLSNVDKRDHDRRTSIPNIRLSREDDQKRAGVSEEPETSGTQKRRMSALSQARLAFEKVAMAVSDAETVTKARETTRKSEKGKHVRSQSAARDTVSPSDEKKHSTKKGKTLETERHVSRERTTTDAGIDSLEGEKRHLKSMQQLDHQQQTHDMKRNQNYVESDISIEGVSMSTSAPHTSTSSARKSSVSFKLLHSLARPAATVPHMHPTPTRQRKKLSRGHIDQDPLEVDYEILDDTVTNVEPRKPIPAVHESKRQTFNSQSSQTFAEEPLLKQHQESERKLNVHPRDLQIHKPAQRPSSIPYTQTFPRTKNQHGDPYSPNTELDKPIRITTSTSFDRTRHMSPNQLHTPDSVFPSLHKIPSQSSFTSSDARSDVCLDLPDIADHVEADLHLHESVRDTHDIRVTVGFPNAPYSRIVHYTQTSLVLVILLAIGFFIVSFILLWPLLVLIIVIVPVVVLVKRLCSWLCCCGASLCGRCCLCLCHTHLTSSELMWLGQEKAGGSAVVQSLLVLQKGLDTERIRHLIDSRLLSLENRQGHRIYERFTQKVVAFCCGHAWVTDHHFVVSRHVFNMPGYIETLEDLQHFISKMAGEPLCLDHPLWEIQVLHNFREPRDTVLLFRIHACVTDGVSLVHVLENALVDSQKISHQKRSFSAEVANTSPFKVLFSGPVTFLSKYLFSRPDFNLLHGRHVRPCGEMVVAWSEPFSLSAAMRVKQVARCTLSELLLSITAGNMRTYLQVNGISHPYNIKCALPVDFQSMNGGTLDISNKYSLVIHQLPTNTEGVIPRLWQVKCNMGKFKSSAEAAIVSGACWLTCCLLPVSLFQRLWCKIYSQCTLLVANLAGPTSVLKIDSREVKCMMYWLPPLDKVPITVSFITYADQIRMAVISERSVIPNPDLLTRDFNHKMEILSKLLAHRRIPGETAASNRQENVHLLSGYTLDDLTADQIQLEMSLVEQELHDLKVQLDSGSSHHISHNDTQLMSRIEALKERSRELMMHLRRRKADESESAVVLSEEDDLESELGADRYQKPFRRRTMSVSSKLSTASVSSTARPLSTASASNLPSPVHAALPSWPEGDTVVEEHDESMMNKIGSVYTSRTFSKTAVRTAPPVYFHEDDKGHYHSMVS